MLALNAGKFEKPTALAKGGAVKAPPCLNMARAIQNYGVWCELI